MNYGELQTLVRAYLECDEATFIANIGQFVELMEEDVYRKVQILDLRKNATSTFTNGIVYLQMPTDYLSPYSMAVVVAGEYRYLQNKDVNFMREAYPNPTTTDVPRFYAHFDDDTFIVAPTPNSAYVVELHYFYEPASLSTLGDSGTTWLSENAENVVLFGTILQGYTFLKGDQDTIAQYQKKYDDAISNLLVIYEGRVRKDTYRVADRRIPT